MKFSDQFYSMEKYITELQQKVCSAFENLDTAKFSEDEWKREEGGGGITKVIENGKIIEKGGVNISSVYGKMSEAVAGHLETEPSDFGACGISVIIHPFSPKIPTIHMNVRYFEISEKKYWFGGGIDLTPYFPYTEDFKHFHQTVKNACDKVIPNSYADFKAQCDDYFTIKHRNEMRGVGGIFFDYLSGDKEKYFKLITSVGDSFLDSYIPIVLKRKDETYSQEDKDFQLVRRGRYVEFNLIYDRGTIFGLKTGGRLESILISLPPEVKFVYNKQPEPDTPHFEMNKYYQPINWVEYQSI